MKFTITITSPAAAEGNRLAGPVNLPPDAGDHPSNPIRKVASYGWIENAVEDSQSPSGGQPQIPVKE